MLDPSVNWADVADSGASDEYDSDDNLGRLNDDELREKFSKGELGNSRSKPGFGIVRERGSIDEAGLLSKLKEISTTTAMPWVETNLVTTTVNSTDLDPSDDFARENAFYDSAVAASQAALKLFDKYHVPVRRPSDYYAEMLKTDEHMERIKEKIINEGEKIKAAERARKQRDNKKYGKKIQQDVLAQRQKAKSEAMAGATKMRKGLQQKMDARDDDFGVSADGDDDKSAVRALQDHRASSAKTVGKRNARNQKFGFGGKNNNSRAKANDRASFLSGDKGFSPHKNKQAVRGTRGSKPAGKKGGAKKNQRPGKSKRKRSNK